jgi:chemotaxis protein MotB
MVAPGYVEVAVNESPGTQQAGGAKDFRDPSRSRALPPQGPLPASGSPSKLRGGRFERWHLEPAIAQEEEGWLLTYLDVITLLLVMMVVMLSLAGPGNHGAPASTTAKAAPAANPVPLIGMPGIVPPLPVSMRSSRSEPEPQIESEADLLAGLALDHLDKNIEVIVNKGTVSFRISSELLFNSGEANLSGAGQGVMSRLVPALSSAPGYRVVVEGHTDNVPIQTERFPSNWELSTGRAASVVRHLQSQGIDAARMRATGYADTRPIASNDTAQGKATNRHVEVILEASR